MPAKSEKQANLMRMALAVKTGKKKLSDMPAGIRDEIKKINKEMTEEQLKHFTVNEDGEAGGPPGGAVLDSTVGRGSFEFGNNPQDTSDQSRGSGEPSSGNKERELTSSEMGMFEITKRLASGETKIVNYQSFKAMVDKKHFTTPDKVRLVINEQLGDFGQEAHKLISNLPIVNGLLEIKGINEALASTYSGNQVKKVINAILS